MHLSEHEKALFIRWVAKNVGAHLVPSDEGSDEGLVYNLVHAVYGDGKRWDDEHPDRWAELEALGYGQGDRQNYA